MGEAKPTAEDAAAGCACLGARKAARATTRLYDAALRPLDLRITQFTLLAALRVAEQRGTSLSITELADELAMERTTLSRNLGPLEARGLVGVGPEGAHRARPLSLTKAGRRLMERALPLWAAAQESLRAAAGEGPWRAMLTSLPRVTAAALTADSAAGD